MEIKVQGASIHVAEKGQGPPLVLLHGNPDSSEMWTPIVERLNPKFRCIAPDLPGFGRSGVPADLDVSLEGMSRFLDELFTSLSISEPINLVAHDFGATFGLAWAIRHQNKVRRIAISNVNFFTDYKWHIWGKIWRMPLLGELSMATMTWPAFRWSLTSSSPRLTDEHVRKTYDNYPPTARKMALRLYRAVEPASFNGWQDELLQMTKKIPLLALWGDKDPFISPSFAERFGARRVVHYHDCGHWAPIEVGDQAVDELVKFFASTD